MQIRRPSSLIALIRVALVMTLSALSCDRALAEGEPALPYSTRTTPYSAWGNTVRGDISSVGMAGAMVGIADTIIGVHENPAGLAMTLPGTAIQVSGNTLHDQQIQSFDREIATRQFGTATNIYPWGFAASISSPYQEGQPYRLPDGRVISPEISLREYRIAAARLLFKHRVALGVGVIMGEVQEKIDGEIRTARSMDATFGLMYQLPKRWLLGLSYTPPMNYTFRNSAGGAPSLPGFFQNVRTPFRLGAGVGWIPNRFFRAGASVYLVGSTPDATLFRDQNVIAGQHFTLQPRLGAGYVLAEFKELKIETSAGTYYEMSRVESSNGRLHLTAGLEISPWIFNLGWGVDRSRGYKNYIYSAGIDVIRVMRKLDLIRRNYDPPRAGLMPPPFRSFDEDLPRPLVQDWVQTPKNPNILEISRELPERLEKRMEKTGKQLEELGRDVMDAFEGGPKKKDEQPKKRN